jgi:hypothetical protein
MVSPEFGSMVSPEFSELYDELYGFYRVNPVEWE